jgi:hypothetical protein
LAKNKGDAPGFFMSAPPANIKLSIKNSPYEWSTWGMWDAPNRPTGLPISIFMIDTLKKVKVQIKDAQDALIRTLSFKVDSGFNRNYWGYEQKGKRGAGAPKTGGGGRRMMDEEGEAGAGNADDKEFSGRDVLPGKYKIVVIANDKKDSAWVEVKSDSRIASANDIVLAQDVYSAKLQVSNDKFNAALDQIEDAELILASLKTEWKDKKDKGVDTLTKAHKIITEKVKGIRETMFGKKQEKQGYGTVPVITPISIIRAASMLINAKNTMPGSQEDSAIDNAATAADNIVIKVNAFFAKDWADFRKLVEANPIKKFKDIETIK